MTGEIAALSASALWATASVLFAQLGKQELRPIVLNLLKCTIALSLMWVTMLVLESSAWPLELTTTQLAALAVSGIIGLTLGDTAYFGALVRLGPRKTLLFSTLAPPTTAVIAWPVLGEPITTMMLVGMALTLGGIIVVISERASASKGEGSTTRTFEWVGYSFALLAVICQATGNVLTKLGGEEISSLATSVVRLSFGSIGLVLLVSATGYLSQVTAPFKQRATALKLFIATFLGTYLGIWLLVTGLQYTQVGVAATLSSMSPIFILPIAALFLGERLTARAIIGAIIAVAGVAVLSLMS